MKKHNLLLLGLGILAGCEVFAGCLFLASSDITSAVSGIVVICLSIATGLVLPNPLSFVGLIAGILMLALPAKTVGIILLILGIAGCLCPPAIRFRQAHRQALPE